MALIEKGRKVIIVRGADAGKEAEVVEVNREKGKGVMLRVKIKGKERTINIRHVEPLRK